jgi:hypothetical protein
MRHPSFSRVADFLSKLADSLNPKTAILVAERGTRFDIAGFGITGLGLYETKDS